MDKEKQSDEENVYGENHPSSDDAGDGGRDIRKETAEKAKDKTAVPQAANAPEENPRD